MYMCDNCNAIFETPKIYSEDKTPGESFEGMTFIEYYEGCPICSETFKEANQCYICGNIIDVDDGIYIDDIFCCHDCYDKNN